MQYLCCFFKVADTQLSENACLVIYASTFEMEFLLVCFQGKLFPSAQFCVTGVLGPLSNAHGPNEFLHIDFSRRLTCCIASILASHCASKVDAELRQVADSLAIPKKSRGDAGSAAGQVDVSDLILPANERNER